MAAPHDHQCRSIRLWEFGLLDQLRPNAGHAIIACAHEKNVSGMMMEDLANSMFNWEKNPVTLEQIPSLLDALARLHTTYWNNPDLKDIQPGLCHPADLIHACSPSTAKQYNKGDLGALPEWVSTGWASMEELLDREVFRQMLELVENPAPLLKAMERYPLTLVHGDFRRDNLAFTNHFIILDWQLAACSLMTIDLAWFTRGIRDLIDREKANQIYRERLEIHLHQEFEDLEWQAMDELGYAVIALRATCLDAYWYKFEEKPEIRETARNLVLQQTLMVMDALRWL